MTDVTDDANVGDHRPMPDDRVAFIGTGTMGTPMATRLLAGGFELRVHDTVPAATDALVAAGASACATAAEAASDARIVMLSLPGPAEVLSAVVGEAGVLAAAPMPEEAPVTRASRSRRSDIPGTVAGSAGLPPAPRGPGSS